MRKMGEGEWELQASSYGTNLGNKRYSQGSLGNGITIALYGDPWWLHCEEPSRAERIAKSRFDAGN